jgi:spore coat protein U-like protein
VLRTRRVAAPNQTTVAPGSYADAVVVTISF